MCALRMQITKCTHTHKLRCVAHSYVPVWRVLKDDESEVGRESPHQGQVVL